MAVVGATASGKTDLSLDLAERLGGEIVNTDAMAVYRGMDVGTAKLPAAERRGIPHHLLDILDRPRPADGGGVPGAGARRRSPTSAAAVRSRSWSVVPRSTPGRSWTGSSSPGPTRWSASGSRPSSPRSGPRRCTGGWATLDAEAAARILPENGRRVVRALEVIEITGRPFSASLPVLEYLDPASVQVGVDIDRPTLDERIELRVDRMFEDGFVDEVARLLDEGLAEGRTASRAIGYREVAAYLSGELTLAEAREQTMTATRRFARRQDSWFRKDPRITWVRYDDPPTVWRPRSRRSRAEQDRSGARAVARAAD